MMTKERLEYLEVAVLGSNDALEYFSYLRDEQLSIPRRPSQEDPNNESAKIAMAVLETYQYFINIHNSIKEGQDNERTTTGNPTT